MTSPPKLLVGFILAILLIVTPVTAVKTFTVTETDIVKLKADSIDPDNDLVVYTYSAPLDANGEWRTTYDDAGDYYVNITASDGTSTTVKTVRVVVKNKNRPPTLTSQKITAREEEVIDLKPLITDSDGDVVSFEFQEPFDQSGVWKPSYKDSGSFVTEFTASDGSDELQARVEIEVLPTNHAPTIHDSFSAGRAVHTVEDKAFDFFADAEDVDKDVLTYTWKLDGKVVSEERSGEIYFDYASAGMHLLSVQITDGKENIAKEWDLAVENKNRKPELQFLPITVQEGERVKVPVPKRDRDGDLLTYNFEQPLDERGEWQTGYEDEGKYTLDVTGFDGQLFAKTKIEVTVLNTDRPPELRSPDAMSVYEGEKAIWNIESKDPDGDRVSITVDGLPEGAVFDAKKKIIEWRPGYATIQRSGGKISHFLNTIRLENFLLRTKSFPITITSCGEEACTIRNTAILVYNTNRGPELTVPRSITVQENEEVKLEAAGEDPDGDVLHYYYTKPFSLRGGKWTPQTGDAGKYTVYVTATDGKIGQTEPVTVNVLKTNLPPALKIPQDEITVMEDHIFSFAVSAVDPNNDNVTIRLENMPRSASFKDGRFEWQPDFNTVANKTRVGMWTRILSRSTYLTKKFSANSADIWLRFIADDGQAETVHPIKITVKDLNRKPELLDALPEEEVAVPINEPVPFHVAVKDEDKDPLQYTWSFNWDQEGVEGTDTIQRTFVTPGVKKVRVVVSDGFSEIIKEWNVGVVEEKQLVVEEEPVQPEEIPFTIKMYVLDQ